MYSIIISTITSQREPCDPNQGINKELRPTLRAQICAYKSVSLTSEQIGARTFCTPVTITSTLRRNPQRNDFKSLPRSGRLPALSRRDRRLILRIVRRNPKVTYHVLKQEAGVIVHTSTLYLLLKDG